MASNLRGIQILNKKSLGFSFGILSAIAWGTSGTFCLLLSNYGLSTLNTAMLAPLSNLIFFSLVLLFSNRRRFIISCRTLLILMAEGAASALSNIAFVKSVSYFPVGIVTTLVFCNIFVLIILSRVVFKNRITPRKIVAALVAALGVSLVLNVFSTGFALNSIGLCWILFTLLSWAMMVTLDKYLLESGIDGIAMLMYTALFAVLFLSLLSPPWLLAGNIVTSSTRTGGLALLAVFGYALIPQATCFFFYVSGLKLIEPSYIQIAYSLDPVTAIILGLLVFRQTLQAVQVLGILLILTMVCYVQVKEGRTSSP
jgi:drug/metabolite transporter (DMT)-like permease